MSDLDRWKADPELTAEDRPVLDLLRQIEEVRWYDDYVELRFPSGFDGSVYIGEEGGRTFFHMGPRSDRSMMIALTSFAVVFYNESGRVIMESFLLSIHQQEYVTRHSGKSTGVDWLRFSIPAGTASLHLFESVGKGVSRYDIGVRWRRPETIDPLS